MDELFDDDYLYFYDAFLTPDIDQEDADAAIALAGLAPGVRVLDAGCGHGRLTRGFLAQGCRVVGVDRSARFLDVAVERAPEVAGHLVRGDFGGLPVASASVDAVVCWFTAFGIEEDDALRQVLTEFRRILAPGGRLVLDLVNRDRLARRFPSQGPLIDTVELGDDVLVDRAMFDVTACRTRTERRIVRAGHVRRLSYSVRVFTPTELTDWLRRAGFAAVTCTGPGGAPLTLDSRRLVAVATC